VIKCATCRKDCTGYVIKGDDETRARVFLEMELVAYALLDFKPGQKWTLREDSRQTVQDIIDMVREKDKPEARR
jgi:hypothetical protein